MMRFWNQCDIDYLAISLRTINILKRENITSFQKMRELGPYGLKAVKGIGKRQFNELMEAIHEFSEGPLKRDDPGKDLRQMIANRDFLLEQYRNLVAHMKPSSDGAIYASVSRWDALNQVHAFLESIAGAGYGGMAEFETARATIQFELEIGFGLLPLEAKGETA
ncbi:DNA-directed RNA polymerase subunit alpha C-terminal domain-containing protein [Bradyrhizobium sp. USDA 4452]